MINHDEQPLKLTDLDYLTGDHHLQMMKAALPYMNVPQQRVFSAAVKVMELKRTMGLFHDQQVAAMGISSPGSSSPADMLEAIRPYGNPREQETIGLLINLLRGVSSPAMDQMKSFLSPEQQSRMDAMQLMIQAMQQTG